MSKETRVLTDRHDIRAVDDDGVRRLVGYGAVFGSLSQDLGGFREKIHPGAFNRTLATGRDVVVTMNHDMNMLLGRTQAGTAKVSVDDVGLRYSVDVPETQAGRDAWTLAQRGDLAGSSFTFSISKNGDRWERDAEGRVREVMDAGLYELGPVVTPAYLDTTVAARSLADIVTTEEETESQDEEPIGDDVDGEPRATTLSVAKRRLRTVR